MATLQLTVCNLFMKIRKKRAGGLQTRVVGSVHTLGGLQAAARLRPGQGIDMVEVRLDFLADEEGELSALLRGLKLPVLLTARHPREGGAAGLTASRRGRLLEAFLPYASLIDIELRSVMEFSGILAQARRRRVRIVLSYHNFAHTPRTEVLARKQREARAFGADICKIAVQVKSAASLARLLGIQACAKHPLATMGMGPLGKVSRLVLPLAGSRLAYGYIDRPQVPGQWAAAVLAQRLEELAS